MNEKALTRASSFIDSWLKLRLETFDVPGITVTIAHKGKIIFNHSYGYANIEKKEKLTPEHKFRVASHSKTFTATAVMQLQEKGALGIDDKVATYLKWLADHKDSRYSKVTIRQLLSHSAGIIRDGANQDFWNVESPFPDEEKFKKYIFDSELVFENNTRFKYSNFGYTLLGLVIEAASGNKYRDYVIKNIVDKLGLKNTGPDIGGVEHKNFVTGYTRRDYNGKRKPIQDIDTGVMSAATGFFSTAEDLCTYFYQQRVGSDELLGDESKKEMQRPQWLADSHPIRSEYGLGFEIDHINDKTYIGHGGGFPGQTTNSRMTPDGELTIVVLSNCISGWSGYISRCILGIIDFYQDNSPAKTTLTKYEGRYYNLWNICDYIATPSKLLSIYPDQWEPFDDKDELELLDDKKHVFKITKTSSFGSEGEKVHFDLAGKKVVVAGDTMLQKNKFIAKTSQKPTIGY